MNMLLNLFQLYRHVLGPDPSEIHRSLYPSYVVDNSLSHACLKKTEDAVLAIPGRPDWNRSAKSFDGSQKADVDSRSGSLLQMQLPWTGAARQADPLCVGPCESAPRIYSARSENLQRYFVRVLSNSRPSGHPSCKHHHEGLSGPLLSGRHVAISHHSSPVRGFAEAAFRWRKQTRPCLFKLGKGVTSIS